MSRWGKAPCGKLYSQTTRSLYLLSTFHLPAIRTFSVSLSCLQGLTGKFSIDNPLLPGSMFQESLCILWNPRHRFIQSGLFDGSRPWDACQFFTASHFSCLSNPASSPVAFSSFPHRYSWNPGKMAARFLLDFISCSFPLFHRSKSKEAISELRQTCTLEFDPHCLELMKEYHHPDSFEFTNHLLHVSLKSCFIFFSKSLWNLPHSDW